MVLQLCDQDKAATLCKPGERKRHWIWALSVERATTVTITEPPSPYFFGFFFVAGLVGEVLVSPWEEGLGRVTVFSTPSGMNRGLTVLERFCHCECCLKVGCSPEGSLGGHLHLCQLDPLLVLLVLLLGLPELGQVQGSDFFSLLDLLLVGLDLLLQLLG